MASGIILHCYDLSPFTQKALRMLGIKGLDWQWVETAMLPPKDDLVALTGGYRGTPVMQIGRHVYIDTQLIARELERRFPAPTLYPDGNRALAHMLVKWSDALFRATLAIAIEKTSAGWPAEFLADRKYLFPDVDFAAAQASSAHAREQTRAHALLVEEQLADGRAYLLGAKPGLVDIQAHVFVSMARMFYPDVAGAVFDGLNSLAAWEARMAAIGEGKRERISAAQAFAAARASTAPTTNGAIDAAAAQGSGGWGPGQAVTVGPDDTRRGDCAGELIGLDREQIVIRRVHDLCGEVAVHFPRLGYRLTAA
jgi:glutathione S-transferase